MFCPNCGNDCGNANFCSNCGYNLKGTIVTVSTADNTPDKKTEMLQRYGKYIADRNKLGAIKALRTDTGMGLVEASQVIDELFADVLPPQQPVITRAEKKAELKKSGQVFCPKCLSTSISANKKGFGIGKAVVGAAAFGGIGLAAGNMGAKKVICTCLKCGYQWKAGKR